MENKDKPAYPTHGGSGVDDPRNQIIAGGLTKREIFAKDAMMGIQISVYSSFEMYKHQLIHWREMYGDGTTVVQAMAKDAIMQADELLKQLSE